MGDESCDFISGTLRSARAHDLPHELLSRDEIARRHPQFTVPSGQVGVWEPKAGMLRPEAAISVMAELALRAGATIHGHEPVTGWTDRETHVQVSTERAVYDAEQVVFCAGAWTGSILGAIGVDLEVARNVLAWVWPARPERFGADRFPIWGLDDPEGFFYYGFPMHPGRVGLKLARHHRGEPTTVQDLDRSPRPSDEAEIRSALESYLPEAVDPVLSMSVCMYTNSPDGHFIIDRHPRHERILFASGFSGHGFKFAPVVGTILADLVMDGVTALPAEFLRLSRFGLA